MNAGKLATALIAAATALAGTIPAMVHKQACLLIIFVMVDFVTGVWVAAQKGEVRSRTMSSRTFAKLMQYALILTLFAGGAVLASNWYAVAAGLAICLSIEVNSLMENLICLQQMGVNLGPFMPLIVRASKYFAVGDQNETQRNSENAVRAADQGFRAESGASHAGRAAAGTSADCSAESAATGGAGAGANPGAVVSSGGSDAG